MSRVRIRFSKLGKVRFTSHRDLARILERSLRKAAVPVAYSEGFTPRPKVSFGLALPVGAESIAEYLDVELAGDHRDDLAVLLNGVLPPGFSISLAEPVDRSAPSLQEDVAACEWVIELAGVTQDEVSAAVERVLAAATLPMERTRKGEQRHDDVRPAIERLTMEPAGERPSLRATLATRPRGLRPAELLTVCFPDLDPIDVGARVIRTCQWIERDGARRELLPLPVAGAPTPAAMAAGG